MFVAVFCCVQIIEWLVSVAGGIVVAAGVLIRGVSVVFVGKCGIAECGFVSCAW
jgi:hypothetical protein